MEHKGDLHPQVVVEDPADGKILDFYYMPERAHLEVEEGQIISPGAMVAKTPREASGTQDITGGLPRVTEIFEARKPKDPAVIAEIDGTVELLSEKKRGKRSIIVRSESGIEREHLITHNKHLRVHSGDIVRAGDALVDGPLVPHDILRISGEEAVQQYLVREIQNVYRSQRVEINDKHIEIIVARMLRKVRVETPGDTNSVGRQRDGPLRLPRGERGDHEVPEDHREGRRRFCRRLDRAQRRARAGQLADRGFGRYARQGHPAEEGHRRDATVGHHQGVGAKLELHLGRELPGNHQGAHRSGARGSNRPLGRPQGKRHPRPLDSSRHRLPQTHDSEVRIRPEALEALAAEKERALERSFPLLESALAAERGNGTNSGGATAAPKPAPAPSGLDALLGGAVGGGGSLEDGGGGIPEPASEESNDLPPLD